MHCVQISWVFYFILCLWPKLCPEIKNHLLWLRKIKQTSQPLLLSTLATPSQQNRWRWIFERSFYTFQTITDLILTQIQRWIWEKQLINQKSRGFTMEILPWNPLQHPLLPTPTTPSHQNQWRWIFERSFYTFQNTTILILTQIQRWIWEKQLIQLKSRGFITITCYTQLHSILHFFSPKTFPSTPPTHKN
jgi:hypothetical protein